MNPRAVAPDPTMEPLKLGQEEDHRTGRIAHSENPPAPLTARSAKAVLKPQSSFSGIKLGWVDVCTKAAHGLGWWWTVVWHCGGRHLLDVLVVDLVLVSTCSSFVDRCIHLVQTLTYRTETAEGGKRLTFADEHGEILVEVRFLYAFGASFVSLGINVSSNTTFRLSFPSLYDISPHSTTLINIRPTRNGSTTFNNTTSMTTTTNRTCLWISYITATTQRQWIRWAQQAGQNAVQYRNAFLLISDLLIYKYPMI